MKNESLFILIYFIEFKKIKYKNICRNIQIREINSRIWPSSPNKLQSISGVLIVQFSEKEYFIT